MDPTATMVLDDLRRRARKGKWVQKFVAILIALMMLLGGVTYIISTLTGT